MKDFFYGVPKWMGIWIIVTVILIFVGLGGYFFLG